MKIKLLPAIFLASFLLGACQDGATNTTATNEAQTEETEEVNSTEQVESEKTVQTETEPEEVTYQYQINPETFSVEPINPEEHSEEKLVLLTFDDAPYGNSLQIAEALNERDVSALFFVNSMYMEDEEGFEAIQQLHEMGFEIGNHTHTHAKLDDYTEEEQKDEILTTNEFIEEATGEQSRFFRAPHGVMTDYSKQLIEDEDMSWMNWSFGYDWMGEYQDPTALTDITLNTDLLGNGSNILMHDRTWTAEAVPEIMDGLIEQGFKIVDPKLITHE